jgi:hypothetical protein
MNQLPHFHQHGKQKNVEAIGNPKCLYLSTRLHGAITQKIEVVIFQVFDLTNNVKISSD